MCWLRDRYVAHVLEESGRCLFSETQWTRQGRSDVPMTVLLTTYLYSHISTTLLLDWWLWEFFQLAQTDVLGVSSPANHAATFSGPLDD